MPNDSSPTPSPAAIDAALNAFAAANGVAELTSRSKMRRAIDAYLAVDFPPVADAPSGADGARLADELTDDECHDIFAACFQEFATHHEVFSSMLATKAIVKKRVAAAFALIRAVWRGALKHRAAGFPSTAPTERRCEICGGLQAKDNDAYCAGHGELPPPSTAPTAPPFDMMAELKRRLPPCEVCGIPATHVVDSDRRHHVCGPHVGTVTPAGKAAPPVAETRPSEPLVFLHDFVDGMLESDWERILSGDGPNDWRRLMHAVVDRLRGHHFENWPVQVAASPASPASPAPPEPYGSEKQRRAMGLGIRPVSVPPEPTLTEQVERLQVQLAGCSVAAMGGTKDPADRFQWGWSVAYQDVLDLRLKYDALHDAVQRALNELGVPQPGYPQPVANAVDILRAALARAQPQDTEGGTDG